MRRFGVLVSALVLVLAVMLVPASGFAKDFFLTPKVGTQGIGADLGYKVTPKFGARANFNYFTYSHDDTIEDVDYDADLDLTTAGALLDYHPFEGNFRITGGAYYNGNGLDLEGKLAEGASYEIGGNTYTTDELGSLEGDVDFNSFAPYFGIGWGTSTDSGSWAFSLDLGAMYQGSPDVSLDAKNQDTLDEINDQTGRDLGKDLDKEASDIEDDVDYGFYPVVSVGVTYRF